jgi:hypothetical protein
MTKYASADALKNLQQLPRVKEKPPPWNAPKSSSARATEAVQALANAIRRDCSLEPLNQKTLNNMR